MELKDATVVILVCVLSYATCIGSVPTCTNYRPIRMYGNWCFKYQLHWAALAGHMEEVTRLIQDGDDVNQQTSPGRWTPLHFAANYGRASIIKLLFSKGANPLMVTTDNFTPKHRAQAKYCKGYRTNSACGLSNFNYFRSMRMLENAEKKAEKSKQSIIPTCINYRPKKMYGNWCSKYPLHWAAQTGHLKEVSRLIDDGADVNQLTQPGRWTPLHFAANYGRANAVDRLLSKGANPELRSSDNFTPRHRAQAKYCKGYRANTSCGLSSFNYNRTIRILLKAEKKLRKSNKRKG